MKTLFRYSELDVDKNLAYRAHSGTSWVPDTRALSEVESYTNYMEEINSEFSKWATDENRPELERDLSRFKAGYIVRLHAWWAARSRIISSFISGPSNYPTRQMKKRNDTADRRLTELLDYKKKVLGKLRKKYNPSLAARRIVSSDAPDAIEQLQEKIDKAQARQDFMKAANRIIRSKKKTDDQKVAALQALDETIKEETARRFISETDFAGRVGFPSYQLANNNANIRRMKKRIEKLQAEQVVRGTTPSEYKINGVRLVENDEMNRLQILFDGKPSMEMRNRLKSRGFHWAPSHDAWQRKLNNSAREAAKWVLEE